MATHTNDSKRANFELARGINAFSANSQARRNGRFAYRRAEPATAPSADEAKKEKAPFSTRRWYPADYIPKKLPSAKTLRNSQKTAKLRKSITPGTVLILLSGRFRGKRVVFLKQLPSGTLLVTGPYKVNGVPLRRVNQSFVIATSTKVDLTGVILPEIDDAYFAKPAAAKKSAEEQFYEPSDKSAPRVICEQRKNDQKAVDDAILPRIQNDAYLRAYLNAKFSLTKNDRVHELRF